jgi:diguanylate cyclase (GGDEF)-like protein
MRSRYGALATYSLLLTAIAAAALTMSWWRSPGAPAWWVVVLGIASCLFVWQFGLRAPRLGLISMERLPQIGLLLVLEPVAAASICGAASLLWPLVSRRYSQGSLEVAGLRAIHNASMTVLMLLLAGQVYLVTGGRHPLTGLASGDILPLLAMALAAQAVNICLMMLFFRFDGRDVRRIVTPWYALSDLIFVPAGVLAALLFNHGDHAVFGLFAGLMMLFVLSFNSIGSQRGIVSAERGPLTRLFEASLKLQGARRVDVLAERVLTETRTLFRFDELHFLLVDRDQRVLDVRVHEREGRRMPARIESMDAGLFGWLASRAEPLLVKDWRSAPDEWLQRVSTPGKSEPENPTGSLLAMPLVHDGIVLGLLCVSHAQPGTYASADLHLMRQLGEQTAGALADARAFEDLENYRRHLEERVAARTDDLQKANAEKERLIDMLREHSLRLERETQEDALTGIANRRCFMQRLAAEMDVARAVGHPLSVAIADLDHFKVVNDALGHPVGDQALRQSASVMRRGCNHGDLLARIGGEEFALLLPGMTQTDALGFCERLRADIAAHDWRGIHAGLAITISIGVTQWDGRSDLGSLLRAADSQLYRAKNAGRNQVA